MFIVKWFSLAFCFYLTSAQSYRLPKDVVPQQYNLSIITHLGEINNFTFDGTVAIKIKCLQDTANITIHSKDLQISNNSITVTELSDGNKTIPIKEIKHDKVNDFITIILEKPLENGKEYLLYIPFRGELNDGLAGFYRSSYKDNKTNQKRWLGVTQFEPTYARRAFPCFDEPAMKARFQINLGRHKDYSSVSNMPLVKTEPLTGKEGWVWDKYENSVPMSTYLVAFMVSDFGYKTAEKTKSNVTFNIWARKGALNQVDFAKTVGPQFLDYYEEYFDVKYPLPKQDMVALPDFSAGAMENWGLITYREAYLLYDSNISSTTSKHSLASVVAHELAHQWFGNLVTMRWWTDLWLNEGFATYMAGLAVHRLFPQWNSLEEEAASNLVSVFNFDSLKSSHPVSVPIGHPDRIDEIFDTISYKKGSFLIRMMGLFLGEDVLRKGVSNYLKEHKYGNAEQDDLWAALTEEAKKSDVLPEKLTVKTIMDSWTLQTGYPVIHVDRDYEKNSAKISQKRFLRDTKKSRLDEDKCWWIPLTYTTEKEANFNETRPKQWLSCDGPVDLVQVGEADQWMIANVRSSALYRVNYDEKNWQMLTKYLNSENFKNIPTINRVQLIDDSSDLSWTGDLQYATFFNLLKYLKFEDEYLPWKSALANLGEIKRMLRISPAYGSFQVYLKQLLEPIYNKKGGFILRKSLLDKLDSVKHQILITSWACRNNVDNCTLTARSLFNQWKSKSTESPIPKDMRSVIYCTTLRNGDSQDWDFLWESYQRSNVASEKNTILYSLGCTNQPWLLNRYLLWSLNDTTGIRKQDATSVFSSVVGNDIGYYIAKTWFYNNFDKIEKHLSPNSRRISRFLSSLARHISTEADLLEFQQFIENHKQQLSELKQGVEQALETARLNVQWQAMHRGVIENIFENKTID